VPTIKADQNLKIVIEGSGKEIQLDASKFPYFEGSIDIPFEFYPFNYKYAAILPNNDLCFENLVHIPRIRSAESKYIQIDDWIVKPFN
jgi:hypothetical protein